LSKIINVYISEILQPNQKWIGVDLDGTLAKYNGFKGINIIGDPIPEMIDRVRRWIKNGKTVKIFTARVSYGKSAKKYIKQWLKDNNLPNLEITNIKDPNMTELWDDRAIRVQKNTGKRIK